MAFIFGAVKTDHPWPGPFIHICTTNNTGGIEGHGHKLKEEREKLLTVTPKTQGADHISVSTFVSFFVDIHWRGSYRSNAE